MSYNNDIDRLVNTKNQQGERKMQNQLTAKAAKVINELREEGGYTNQEIKAAMSDGEICGQN